MGASPATSLEPSLLSLIFSSSGAVIIICVTVIFVATIILILSRRYPVIAFQFKGSKVELRRQEAQVDPKTIEAGAAASPSDRPALAETTVAGTLPSPASDEENRPNLFDLTDAVEKQDLALIGQIFDGFKDRPPFAGALPYDLEVWRNMELLKAGSSGAISELQRIEREKPKDTDASETLARYYLRIRAYQQAALHVEVMFSRADTDERLTTAVLLQAKILEQTNGNAAAAAYLIEKIPSIKGAEFQSRIFADLGEKFSNEKDQPSAIAAYEESLKHDVHNKDARFQLAYLYAQVEALRTLSVRHYRILLQQDRRYWSVQNNLGAEYEKFGLHVLKIRAWRAALERGESYPLGNLMFAHLEAGFLKEAQELYDSAPSHTKSGPRVAAAHSLAQRIEDEERDKLEGFQRGAEKIWGELGKDVFLLGGKADDWVGTWKQPVGEAVLKITKSGEFLQFEETEGTRVRTGSSRASGPIALFSIMESDKNPTPSLGLFSWGGPFNAGYFIVGQIAASLKVLHVADNELKSVHEYAPLPKQD
jgi:hypothetical protein